MTDIETLIPSLDGEMARMSSPDPSKLESFPSVICEPSVVQDVEEPVNPLDRPSSPDPPSYHEHEEELDSVALSRTSSHTFSLQDDDSMSDWTEAFEEQTESGGQTDFESDGMASDTESETSWAHIHSRSVGMN
jgi:hypothetical protein